MGDFMRMAVAVESLDELWRECYCTSMAAATSPSLISLIRAPALRTSLLNQARKLTVSPGSRPGRKTRSLVTNILDTSAGPLGVAG